MSDDVPRPAGSPQVVFSVDDLKTPAHGIATPLFVKARVAQVEEEMNALLKKQDTSLNLRGVVVGIASVAASVIAVIIFLDNRVAAQTDAGIKVHEQRIATLEQQRTADRKEANDRLERFELNQNADHAVGLGNSQKLDALLAAQRVPNPAPTPKDGGQ